MVDHTLPYNSWEGSEEMIVFFFGASKDKVERLRSRSSIANPALNSGLYTIVHIHSFARHQLVRNSDVGKNGTWVLFARVAYSSDGRLPLVLYPLLNWAIVPEGLCYFDEYVLRITHSPCLDRSYRRSSNQNYRHTINLHMRLSPCMKVILIKSLVLVGRNTDDRTLAG
jgi:hypothetical protein